MYRTAVATAWTLHWDRSLHNTHVRRGWYDGGDLVDPILLLVLVLVLVIVVDAVSESGSRASFHGNQPALIHGRQAQGGTL